MKPKAKAKNVSVHFDPAPARAKDKPCYHSHPALALGQGTVYGGAAHDPVANCSIYVSLCQTPCGIGWPWLGRTEIAYSITDQHAPKDFKSFDAMANWLGAQLQDGKDIYVGCVGGHGRTGTLLSALAAKQGQKDAIAWVRKHYCPKAVETQEQVDFLVKHYAVLPAKPRHTKLAPLPAYGAAGEYDLFAGKSYFNKHLPAVVDPVIAPMPSRKSIFDPQGS